MQGQGIEPKKHQNVQETPFWQKAPGFNGLIMGPTFPKDGSFCDKFAKPIPNKPQNARNSAKFGFLAFLLTHCLPSRHRGPWRPLAFLPLLTSSLLNKIGIICAQLLKEKKIFPVMPRSDWLVEWSPRYVQKCPKSGAKISDLNLLPLHRAAPWWKLPVSMTLS